MRLSQYVRECVSTEAIMCKRLEDGLNEDIRLLLRILEIKKFVVLIERSCKAEELGKEKRKANSGARDLRKRSASKSVQSMSKKFPDDFSRSKANMGHLSRDRARSYSSFRAPATSVASAGNVRSDQPECKHCGKRHPRSCRFHDRACFKCGSTNHYILDCLVLAEENLV